MSAEKKKDPTQPQPAVPSSGEGADSALEALKKKRVPPWAPAPSAPPGKKR
jgi:hypothetical protein